MINEFKTEATTEAKASATTSEATTAKTETAMSEQTTAKTADTVTASATATATNVAHMPEWMRDLTPMNLEVSVQLKNHSIRSITNLINTIYTWGPFISIITGANFKADKYLVNTINKREFESREELLAYVKEQTERGVGLTGVRFEEGEEGEEGEEADGEVIFDGFKGVPFANNCGTYSRLMLNINKNALERKSIKARDLTDEEMRDGKRTFAAWLTSIGMKDEANNNANENTDADSDSAFADDRERLLTLVEGVMRAVRARAARRAAAAKVAEDKAVAQTAVAGM